ncbi:MAG: glycosyltransferase, partial [Vicinamibacterales bacterium]|nr:glycosyltransferase [Vicinamibacterales bacterium]
MERIRLFSVIAASGAGGAEQVFATLLQGLDPERFEVTVACHGRGSMAETYRRHASQVWSLDLVDLRQPSTITRLAGLMRDAQCDVVHTHLWTADVLGGLAARLAGVRRVVSSVAGAYFLPIGVSGWRRARRQGFSRLFRAIYRRCDRVIAPSHYVADDLLTRPGIRVPQERLCVIENGVDVDHEERLVRYANGGGSSARWGTGSPRISVVANFFPIKGHEFLIRAVPAVLAVHPQARFVLAGGGESRTAMIGLADRLGVGASVTFPGEIADALELMRASDLVVIPSISEGLPISLVEAMALGRSVVTTGVGGIPEVVEDGVSARVVPPRNPAALAAAMLELLGDDVLARQLGAQAQRVAAERFSAARMVRRTQELY